MVEGRRLNNPSDYQYQNPYTYQSNFSIGFIDIDLMFVLGIVLGWLIGKKY